MRMVLLLFCGMIVAGCDGPDDRLPPFQDIKNATLDYANCVNRNARNLAEGTASTEATSQQAIANCRQLRDKALELKGVPVMFPTLSEFDEVHSGVARAAIEKAREKKTNASN